jgi:tetratricopeptide (TPR) repeat protein
MRSLRRAFVLLFFLPACAGAISPEMDRQLQGALDLLYSMKWSEAEAAVRQVIELDAEHPYGHFGLAAVSMIQYIYGAEQADPALLAVFTKRIDDAIAKGSAWVKKHPQDAEGFMALGAAYGVSARLLAVRHQWLKAYWHGRTAVAHLHKAVKLDPAMGDPYLGLGMYDYYSDAYPRFVRVLAKLFLRGNRARGIDELKRAAAGGLFSQVVSKMLLVEIYLEDQWGLRDTEAAVKLSAEVRGRYPESAMVQAIDLVARYEAGLYDGVLTDMDGFLARARRGEYDVLQLAKGLVIQGTTLWAAGRREEALAALREASGIRVDGKATRWGVWASIRSGNLLDAMGRRQEALEAYKAASAEPDLWDLRQFAKAGQKAPWTDPQPGHISPFGA